MYPARSGLIGPPEAFEPATRHIAANFDYFLTAAPDYVTRYEAVGARCGLLTVATDSGCVPAGRSFAGISLRRARRLLRLAGPD